MYTTRYYTRKHHEIKMRLGDDAAGVSENEHIFACCQVGRCVQKAMMRKNWHF